MPNETRQPTPEERLVRSGRHGLGVAALRVRPHHHVWLPDIVA